MHIGFVVADYPSVSETFIARQIEGMRRRGHAVTIIAGHHYPHVPDPLGGRVPICALRSDGNGPGPRSLRALQRLLHPRRAAALLTALRYRCFAAGADLASGHQCGQYDALVAHFGPMGVRAMLMREAGMISGPLAVVFHGHDMSGHALLRRNLPLYRRLFRSGELLLPISKLWRERLIGWGAPAERTTVLRMGADLAATPAVPDTRPFSAPLRVLSVARLVEKKGIEDAISGVKAAKAAIDYRIIGDGPLRERLTTLAAAPGNSVTLLGSRTHAEVFAALESSDVFLLPSVTTAAGDMEGIPVALMEAMASGVVALATRHSGVPELITDGHDGLLVEERDSLAIAARLDDIAAGRIDGAALRRAARATVCARFNNTILDAELERLLRGLADRDSRSSPEDATPAPHALSARSA
jgi:colanic acid/amylovoran biosynthesis glycosyltransferase